jgi:serine/threonine-protein kinase
LTGGVALFSPGLTLAQRYRLEAPIGSGGMSQVWRAHDPVLGRAVAIKTLDGAAAADPGMRAAIRREARAAARISHPNVTQVFDYGEHDFGAEGDGTAVAGPVTPYLVMELIEGENLAARLVTGPLPPAEAARIGADVASAVAAAHRLGVVHRDIKPANVMLTATGAKVVDFGIAAVAEAGKEQSGPRRAGTPDYTAPEVVRGETATPASDVYGLGALLHATLTGAPPADSSTTAGAPTGVAELVQRCLGQDPGSRPTSEQVAAELSRAAAELAAARPAGGRAVAAASPGGLGPTGRPTGVAAVRPRPVAAHTMLDASVAAGSPAAGSGVAGDPWISAPAALVRRQRPMSLILLAITAAVVGLVLIGAAMLAGPRGTAEVAGGPGGGGAGRATTPAPAPATRPATPEAVLNAMQTVIAVALDQGTMDEGTAKTLADGVRDLRERLDRGRGKELEKKVDDFRDKIDDKAEDGEFDQDVAAELDALLDRLLTLARRG